MNEPIADAVRSILDGHVVLTPRARPRRPLPGDRRPAVASRASSARSRRPRSRAAAQEVAPLLAAYKEKEDLIAIGAYERGSDPRTDRAIDARARSRPSCARRSTRRPRRTTARRCLRELAARAGPAALDMGDLVADASAPGFEADAPVACRARSRRCTCRRSSARAFGMGCDVVRLHRGSAAGPGPGPGLSSDRVRFFRPYRGGFGGLAGIASLGAPCSAAAAGDVPRGTTCRPRRTTVHRAEPAPPRTDQ